MRKLSILLLVFILGCGTQKIANYKDGSTKVDTSVGDGGLDSLISPYKSSMETEMDVVIGTATVGLEKGNPESPLGNFAAEAAYKGGVGYGINSRALGPNIMKRSFALLNTGGLRAPINQGEITVGNIYELMPFDNTLVLLRISGENMRALARYLYKRMGQPVYNATFKLTADSEEMTIGGEPYNFDQDVVVITSDYLASGGDKMTFFNDPILKYDSGKFLRDVFMDYVKETKELGGYELTGKFDIKE